MASKTAGCQSGGAWSISTQWAWFNLIFAIRSGLGKLDSPISVNSYGLSVRKERGLTSEAVIAARSMGYLTVSAIDIKNLTICLDREGTILLTPTMFSQFTDITSEFPQFLL